MVNTKQTLKNLHNKFPTMSLDELFEMLDCYVEEPYWSQYTWNDGTPIVGKISKIWCNTSTTDKIK